MERIDRRQCFSNRTTPLNVDRDSFSALNETFGDWWPRVLKICIGKGLGRDDAEDVTLDVLLEMYENMSKPGFILTDDMSLWKFLRTKIEWRIADYWRDFYRRRERAAPWLRELSDGTVVEVDDYVSDDHIRDLDDLSQRAYIVEIAHGCLRKGFINDGQFDLVRCRMLGEPFPKDWTQQWIDTNWHRVKSILTVKALKNLDELTE